MATLDDLLGQLKTRQEFAHLKNAAENNDPLLCAILAAGEYESLEELAECYDFNLDIPNYTIIKKAGGGGFGLVYKALHADGERAIKILAWPKKGKSPKIDYAYTVFGEGEVVQNELIANAFRHEHIVRYYERGTLSDGTSYLVFEWINGETLEKKGKLTEREFAVYIPQILQAIAHLHTHGYLHNDIRRPNIMIDTFNGRKRITLLDYSIACQHSNGISANQASLASREIIAIEAGRGHTFSIHTDIWALGNLMYQLLAGEHPFPHQDKNKLLPIIKNPSSYPALQRRIFRKIPRKYRNIIRRCLAYYKYEQYFSVDEIIADFTQPSGIRWKLPSAFAVAGAVVAGVWFYQPEETITVKPPIAEKKQENRTGIDINFQLLRIHKGVDKYAVCIPLEDTVKRDICMNFRDAEELIDNKWFARAALVLEDILTKDKSNYQYYAALLHAYVEMGRRREAYEVLQELEKRFPEEEYHLKIATYTPKVRSSLENSGPGFSAFTSEQCDIPLITKRYPECKALAAAASAEKDEAIAIYQEIVVQYPESAHAHYNLGQLLVEMGKQKKLPGDMISYENKELISEGLAHSQKAAELVENTR